MSFTVQLEPCALAPRGGNLQMHPGVTDVPALEAELGRQLQHDRVLSAVLPEEFRAAKTTAGHRADDHHAEQQEDDDVMKDQEVMSKTEADTRAANLRDGDVQTPRPMIKRRLKKRTWPWNFHWKNFIRKK